LPRSMGRRHPRLIAKGGHVVKGEYAECAHLRAQLVRRAAEGHKAHSRPSHVDAGDRFEVERNFVDWILALHFEGNVAADDFAFVQRPTVFDNDARLDRWQSERNGFDLLADLLFNYFVIEITVLQFDDGAIWLDGSALDAGNDRLSEIGDAHVGVFILAASSEDLHANVFSYYVRGIPEGSGLIEDAYLPKENFDVCIGISSGLGQREIFGADGTPSGGERWHKSQG
jgi:hypothetical protein